MRGRDCSHHQAAAVAHELLTGEAEGLHADHDIARAGQGSERDGINAAATWMDQGPYSRRR